MWTTLLKLMMSLVLSLSGLLLYGYKMTSYQVENNLIEDVYEDSAFDNESTENETEIDEDSRTEFLEGYGFAQAEPFYSYVGTDGEVQLELYYDEGRQVGCGIRYEIQKGKRVMRVFAFEECEPWSWTGVPDIYNVRPEYAEYEPAEDDEILNFQENYEYDDAGRMTGYQARGAITWLQEYEDDRIIEIEFLYREDGSLECKKEWYNAFVFGTSGSLKESYYDEYGRILYTDSYITHGSYECYYIYDTDENESNVMDKPMYCLCLDDYISIYEPTLLRYEL